MSVSIHFSVTRPAIAFAGMKQSSWKGQLWAYSTRPIAVEAQA